MNTMRPPPATTAAARTVYDDFKPLFEWKQEHGASLLLIHLPGFTRDHIRVTSEPFNVIKVRGERFILTNNRWTRFNQDYTVPQDCTIRGIRAKLEAGTLTITMPKKIITQDTPPKHTPPPGPKMEPPHHPSPQKESPYHPNPQKPIHEINKTTVENPPIPKKEPPFESNNPQKFIDDIKKKLMDATTPSPPKIEDKKIEDKNMHTTEKASTEAPTPPRSLEDMMKNVVHMPNDNKAEAEQPNKNQKGHDSHADIAEKEKEKDDKGKDKEVSPAAELKMKLLHNEEETKKKDSAEKTSGAGGDQLENLNKMVQGLTLRIKEDKESLVNVGVALLILLALGIYVSH